MGCGSSSEQQTKNTHQNPTKASANTNGKASPTNGSAAAASSSQKDIPHTFEARFERGRDLGKGAFSEAFECTSRLPSLKGKKYACKMTMKDNLNADDRAGIVGEIEILKKLNHPSIVSFIDNFEDNRHYYVVLELMQGGELFDRIVSKTTYNEKEARDLFVVICRGIKFLHDHNIAHRDLKPENLLMESPTDDLKVKIADFGFAKIANGNSLKTMCGSPGYIAPEILNNEPYGYAVDMWALGVITFILLAGYPPFHDDGDQAALFRRIKRAEYTFDLEYWSDITNEAKDLIRGLLTIDPAKRLTADQALTHKWVGITEDDLSRINLDANLRELKKFNANRKFKAAAKAVMAVNKLNHIMGKAHSGKGTSPSALTPNPVAQK